MNSVVISSGTSFAEMAQRRLSCCPALGPGVPLSSPWQHHRPPHRQLRLLRSEHLHRHEESAMVLTTHTKTPNALFRSRLFAIKSWFLERDNFTYGGTNNNLHVVGHYTQMVWATTHEVGCGLSYCRLQDTEKTFYNYVCNYCPM